MKAPSPPPPTKTGGGGDDDADEPTRGDLTQAGPEQPKPIKDRKKFVQSEDFSLSPASLVGSWFHRLENEAMVWQGVVVAEVQPGVYLLNIDKLAPGAENVQRLAKMDQLVNDEDGYDWRFYDNEAAARSAYARWVAAERERV